MEWRRVLRSRFFIGWTLVTAIALFFGLGSRGDRVVLSAVWLAFVCIPRQRYSHQFGAFMARNVLPRYVLLSGIALVWAWAMSRFRGGEGPFHMQVNIWRGYPFAFEEWIFIFNPSFATWREFHWAGLAG